MEVFNRHDLKPEVFGEGCTLFETPEGHKRIHQMTWKSREIYEYDGNTLELLETHTLPDEIEEGWGLTNKKVDGQTKFFVTDGTNNVY
jgi:glutamine cyclotransferase